MQKIFHKKEELSGAGQQIFISNCASVAFNVCTRRRKGTDSSTKSRRNLRQRQWNYKKERRRITSLPDVAGRAERESSIDSPLVLFVAVSNDACVRPIGIARAFARVLVLEKDRCPRKNSFRRHHAPGYPLEGEPLTLFYFIMLAQQKKHDSLQRLVSQYVNTVCKRTSCWFIRFTQKVAMATLNHQRKRIPKVICEPYWSDTGAKSSATIPKMFPILDTKESYLRFESTLVEGHTWTSWRLSWSDQKRRRELIRDENGLLLADRPFNWLIVSVATRYRLTLRSSNGRNKTVTAPRMTTIWRAPVSIDDWANCAKTSTICKVGDIEARFVKLAKRAAFISLSISPTPSEIPVPICLIIHGREEYRAKAITSLPNVLKLKRPCHSVCPARLYRRSKWLPDDSVVLLLCPLVTQRIEVACHNRPQTLGHFHGQNRPMQRCESDTLRTRLITLVPNPWPRQQKYKTDKWRLSRLWSSAPGVCLHVRLIWGTRKSCPSISGKFH